MLRSLVLASLTLTACAQSDDPPLPSCASLGAPSSLLCDSDGLCTYAGRRCRAVADCGEIPAEPALSYGADPARPDVYTVTRSTLDADLEWRAAIADYLACSGAR